MIKNSPEFDYVDLETVMLFINDCLSAMSFHGLRIRKEDIYKGYTELQISTLHIVAYDFDFKPLEFRSFERYLKQICEETHIRAKAYLKHKYENVSNPMTFLIFILDHWKLFIFGLKNISNEMEFEDMFLSEPVGRICMSFEIGKIIN